MCDALVSLSDDEKLFVFLISSVSGVHRVPMGKIFSAAAAFFVRPMKRNPFFSCFALPHLFNFISHQPVSETIYVPRSFFTILASSFNSS